MTARPPAEPRVTVVVPTHDRADHVPTAIESVLQQSYPHVDVVVVDDGSRDETPRVLARVAAAHPRVRVLRNEAPLGPAGARNRGARKAAGDVLAFLDDDSVYAPEKIAAQLEILGGERGVVICRQRIIGPGGRQVIEAAPILGI